MPERLSRFTKPRKVAAAVLSISGTVAEIEDERFRLRADAVQHGAHRRGRAEEEGAADAIDHHIAVRARPAVDSTAASPYRAWSSLDKRAALDLHRLRHAMQEQESAEHDADGDALVRSTKTVSRKVASSTSASPREARSRRQNSCFLRHVPGDDEQHRAERRQRDVGEQAAPPSA